MSGKPSLVIIGTGWLGQALALRALAQGYEVWASHRRQEQALELQNLGVQTFHIQEAWPELGPQSQGLFSLPHGMEAELYFHYQNKAFATKLKRWLWLSSTGVYGGPKLGQADFEENSPCKPLRASAQLAHQAEIRIQNQTSSQTAHLILRLAGLVGAGREPARYLAGRHNLEQGSAPVNLLSLEQALWVLMLLLQSPPPYPAWDCFNVCSPEQPSRANYYTKRCQDLGLPPPHFAQEELNNLYYNKVSGQKLWQYLKTQGYDWP